MRFGLKFFCVVLIVFLCRQGWCHGVEGDIVSSEGYLATARYDDGEPMSYSEMEIKPPDSEMPFLTGRTDRNGRVFFRPDRPGEWQVVVKDGMGHRLALGLTVADENGVYGNSGACASTKDSASSRAEKTVAGLSLIFGLSGLVYGWKSRRLGR